MSSAGGPRQVLRGVTDRSENCVAHGSARDFLDRYPCSTRRKRGGSSQAEGSIEATSGWRAPASPRPYRGSWLASRRRGSTQPGHSLRLPVSETPSRSDTGSPGCRAAWRRYGYRTVPVTREAEPGDHGTPARGEVGEREAEIVREIFRAYPQGRSMEAIAQDPSGARSGFGPPGSPGGSARGGSTPRSGGAERSHTPAPRCAVRG